MYMPVINTFKVRKMSGRRFSLFMVLWGMMSLASIAQTRYYVTPDGQAPKVENAWGGPFYGLEDALSKAGPGDEVWVQGLEVGAVYKPGAQDKPFSLKAGVRLYGGFYGNETGVEQRATQGKACSFIYRSVLSADLNGDDRIDPTSLIYTQNTTRQDNAVRVLEVSVDCAQSDNRNNERSVVDGFTIMGGHADGQNGGGIEVRGGEYSCAYTISRCFFFNNYAARGGAVYVEGNADEAVNTSLIERCMVYNNAAGSRGELSNAGGGIWLDGIGTVVNTSVFNNENGGIRISPSARVVNSTVARNTVAGIDMTRQTDGYAVFNTVVWGNTALFDEISPKFKSSSYHEVAASDGTDADGNIYVGDKNSDRFHASPFFSSPSKKTSFDRDFDWGNNAYPLWAWEVLEGSAFIDKGTDEAYTDYGEADLAGFPRFSNGRIDIGAYEFQAVPPERVLRVRAGASSAAADGQTWETAFPEVQAAINRLAETGQTGEVWVAGGEYAPTELMADGKLHTAAFIMKEGISVYGGFAGNENNKAERVRNGAMPWEYENKTVLKGSGYVSEDETGRKCVWSEQDQKWTVSGSNSNHVVWFAHTDGSGFARPTVLDGVTVKGGRARSEYAGDYVGDRGAGVYMGANAHLDNCIVTENAADGNGGAVYMEGGYVNGTLIYNNNADGSGGGVYMDNMGLVQHSMLANNSADDGGGIYMASHEAWFDGLHPEYLILSTSVVSNNTSRRNGAVYCDRGGVVLQATVTNNNAPNAADASVSRTSRTGGLYADGYALVVNSILWNNLIDGINVPVYADNSSVDKVRFYYTAVSGMGNAVWNNTLQQNLLSLTEANSRPEESVISPDFETEKMPQDVGVQAGWTSVDYYWFPKTGSNLRARGLTLGQLPEDVLLNPELDIRGMPFAQKPCVGAVVVSATALHPQEDGDVIRLYVDVECTTPEHDGSSWEKAYRSANEAIACFAAYDEEKARGKSFEICIIEGECFPYYAFTNLDPKTATVKVSKMPGGATLTIKGGYQRVGSGAGERNPLAYRTWIHGNPGGTALEDGIYHCITVEPGAKVVLDGLHVTGGYAAVEATNMSGAGLLVADGAEVTVRNSIFENNTAANGAAIAAPGATVTLENCVVNNNTNTKEANPVIWCDRLTMHHVTVVNNKGAAPASMGSSSFSAGNTGGDDLFTIEVGPQNFVNPTNQPGATMGYDTYFGGYADFTPLTGSANSGSLINKASGTPGSITTDITGGERSLGGAPDLGAYEAGLPKNGTVIYVKQGGTGEGTSWEDATGNLQEAVNGAGTKQVWVAAGEYTGQFVMKEGVDVMGGFPSNGTPGMNDRNPIQYPTYIQAKEVSPVTDKGGLSEITYNAEYGSSTGAGQIHIYRTLSQTADFNKETTWDGFTIRHGLIRGAVNYDASSQFTYNPTILQAVGAGVFLRQKGKLVNCEIRDNMIYADNQNNNGGGWHAGGAGVFLYGGTLENCRIMDNVIRQNVTNYKQECDGWHWGSKPKFAYNSKWVYGCGLYMKKGAGDVLPTVYNTIISDNKGLVFKDEGGHNSHDCGRDVNLFVVGAGVFGADACNFYGNTVVGNTGYVDYSGGDRPAGLTYTIPGMFILGEATVYNTIISENKAEGVEGSAISTVVFKDNRYQVMSTKNESLELKPADKVYYSNVYGGSGVTITEDMVVMGNSNKINVDPLLAADYQLQDGSPCINTGTEDIPGVDIPNMDAAFTERIKDCTIDMGAYESANEINLGYETLDDGNTLVYYVTQNGAGLRSGASLSDAACAMKLQMVLNHAGATALAHMDKQVVVKLAGYEGETFVYHANTLGNPDNPQSYTYVIPYGVTVMGGYNEQAKDWDDSQRNAIEYMTVLSAISGDGTLAQNVNGYHAVTFGEKPDGWTGAEKHTVVDGLFLVDGKATSMAGMGNNDARGGGAIVPGWAHVRNCVVRNNAATEGGGLFVLPGGIVSGCAVIGNTAEQGAGVFLAAGEVDAKSYLISSTVAGNTASLVGGGVCLEPGAAMTLNTVVWGNTAPSDKNVSGVTMETYPDAVLGGIDPENKEFYPFNNCFVESYEMPSNYGNYSMTTELTDYFKNESFVPKAFSGLIKHGFEVGWQVGLERALGVAAHDMQGVPRVEAGVSRADAGAYAHEGGTMEVPRALDEVVNRIFVSVADNVDLADGEDEGKLLGRSFFTSLFHLGDALEYIRKVRGVFPEAADIPFEIWMAEGTYKPLYTREGATGDGGQRNNSYTIPDNVKVFGGFSGKEPYACGDITLENLPEEFKGEGLKDISGASDEEVKGMLGDRKAGDFNGNGVTEPWDFAHQTILSGRVNMAESSQNVYHVVYSKAEDMDGKGKGVVLDGLTIMDGETSPVLEGGGMIGRGGGVYTDGVDYTLNRCRLQDNKAVCGGALCAVDADVVVSGSVFAGNGTVDSPGADDGATAKDVRGGAVYVEGNSSFKAVNTLWANNEAAGTVKGEPSKGGALATSGAGVKVDLMNNTIVRNKAGQYAAVYAPGGVLTNTAVWGNEGEGDHVAAARLNHSASDAGMAAEEQEGGVELDSQNSHIDGPRFVRPSAQAGVGGYLPDARWNPNSVSVLVDAGEGKGEDETNVYEEWMKGNPQAYQGYMYGSERYAGPMDENGKVVTKPIDIGLYEYQYPLDLYNLDAVYVATEERGDRSGKSWQDATSDLRGALTAMANSTGGAERDKKVFIQAGEYGVRGNLYTGNVAYSINMGTSEEIMTGTLTVKGSYTDVGRQDFGQPTVVSAKDGNTVLLDVVTNGKPVAVEGLAFRSGHTGIRAKASGEGKLTLKNVASRANITGIDLMKSDGDILIVNALMGDGQTGLKATAGTTVVNATFAQNTAAAVEGMPKAVYNSVAWKSGSGLDGLAGEGNRSLGEAENSDIERGPNFVDPDNTEVLQRDYRIRPNLTLLDKGNDAAYQREVLGDEAQPIPDTETDLAGSRRAVGKGLDVGAYEYASELKPVIYVKAGVAGGDQSGSDWANAMGDLQGAADLATVYAQTHKGENGYVFVHGNVKGLPLRLTRESVKVYGSMADETGETPDAVLAARKGLLEVSGRSSLSSLKMAGASVVDGFEVEGEDNSISAGMLSTSILTSGCKLDLGTDGILYNSIVDGSTVSGQGKAVNVTAVNGGALGDALKENTVEVGRPNGYVTDGYWTYQLKETDNENIDGGKTDIKAYMTMAGHQKDLAGNLRVRGTVDNGCFETWNVTGNADVTDGDYPHGKSVVYVREGGELRLKRDYASAAPFNPGFLLLEHGAGLWGGGKQVGLTHFAAERQLTAGNGYKDLVAMPFRVDRMTVDGSEEGQVNLFRYDGMKRAGHTYTFDGSDSEAWTEIPQGGLETVTEGLLFEAPEGQDKDMTLRFYGSAYKEDGTPKQVVLKQYNFNAPWNSPEEPGEKFTHKENMGWNLFGSPYLCTMNYEDMEYGRMLYGYNSNGYYTAQSWNEDGNVQGNIPVGSAVFTQTATLKETETFTVGMRKEEIDHNTRSTKLALYVASAAGKRGLEENDGIYDELQLTAVPSEEASTEFDLACDGVKWMNDNGEPEIFAVRDGGRYSLLSAIDREGTIGVGVSLPEAGMYSIGIPEGCEAEDYEYVMLKDAATGKAADLKEGAYSFRTAEAGVAEGRFTLSFKRMGAYQRHAIYVKSGMGKATVFGVNDGDVVTVVTVDGKVVAVEEAVGSEVTFALAKGGYLFKVAGADGRTTVVKAMVR